MRLSIDDLTSIHSWRSGFQRFGRVIGWFLVLLFGLPLVIGFGWSQYVNGGRAQQQMAQRKAVIATVNGIPITAGDFTTAAQSQGATSGGGSDYAVKQGQVLTQLIQEAVIDGVAAKRNVTASDADVDKAIAQERARVLDPGATDAQWDTYCLEAHGMSAADYRDVVAKEVLPQALFASFENAEHVTAQDVTNQNAQVRLDVVLVPTLNPAMPRPPGRVPPLPDNAARAKADALLAQVKAGGDIKAIAKTNSADFSAMNGGDLNWRPEYASPLGYGDAFDAAVHATATGRLTPVLKASGFQQPGYVFAKVLGRRVQTPKTFDPKKAASDLKAMRAQQKLMPLIENAVKSAVIVWKDPDKKAYYDYAKVMQTFQQAANSRYAPPGGPAPTIADAMKQQALANSEILAMQQRHPDDPTAAKLAADILTQQRTAADTPPAQKAQLREQLIGLYQTYLKGNEDRDVRFTLADLYKEKKDYPDAIQQYDMIGRILNAQPADDAASMNTAASVDQQLSTSYKSVGDAADAAKALAAYKAMKLQAGAEQKKETAAANASQKSAPGVTLPAGGQGAVTATIPAGRGRKSAPASH